MGSLSPIAPVKPVCAVTFAPDIALNGILSELKPIMGKPDSRSPVYDFDFTEYYSDEMGHGLKKVFVGFTELIHPGMLANLKIQTNGLERSWTADGKRRVNLDPGYVTSAKLVLASTKDFAHRLYLGGGIYGDVQLQFRHGKWRTNAWTFPDYRTSLAKLFFTSVRDRYNRQERQVRHAVS
jgi:hypothetical protein